LNGLKEFDLNIIIILFAVLMACFRTTLSLKMKAKKQAIRVWLEWKSWIMKQSKNSLGFQMNGTSTAEAATASLREIIFLNLLLKLTIKFVLSFFPIINLSFVLISMVTWLWVSPLNLRSLYFSPNNRINTTEEKHTREGQPNNQLKFKTKSNNCKLQLIRFKVINPQICKFVVKSVA